MLAYKTQANGTIREIGNRRKESVNGYLGGLNCAELRRLDTSC